MYGDRLLELDARRADLASCCPDILRGSCVRQSISPVAMKLYKALSGVKFRSPMNMQGILPPYCCRMSWTVSSMIRI